MTKLKTEKKKLVLRHPQGYDSAIPGHPYDPNDKLCQDLINYFGWVITEE